MLDGERSGIVRSPTLLPLVGASLLSGLGSLPLHLLPLLIAVVVSEGLVPTSFAGWIGSAYMLGQLGVALALPMLGVSALSRSQAL